MFTLLNNIKGLKKQYSSLYTHCDGRHSKNKTKQKTTRVGEEAEVLEPGSIAGVMYNSTDTMKNAMEVPKKN